MASAASRECNKTDAFDSAASSWNLADCSALDLSCPPNGRATACDNALLPAEVTGFAAALKAAEANLASVRRRASGQGTVGSEGAPTARARLRSQCKAMRSRQHRSVGERSKE